tara:strand:- start:144 stop:611 length:468 start_codon:yes stop_codon:yes gene_type:complete
MRTERNMGGQIYTLRLKLSDFINSPLEESVVEKINEANVHHSFKLQLWYNEDDLTPKDLKSFLEKYESLLKYKTTIKPNNEPNRAEFTWYNIVHGDDFDSQYPYRFQYQHSNTDKVVGIILGLEQFRDCLAFITSDKPSKQERPKRKQKRNDYED